MNAIFELIEVPLVNSFVKAKPVRPMFIYGDSKKLKDLHLYSFFFSYLQCKYKVYVLFEVVGEKSFADVLKASSLPTPLMEKKGSDLVNSKFKIHKGNHFPILGRGNPCH